MKLKDAIDEHRRLIKVLRQKDPKLMNKEAAKQSAELRNIMARPKMAERNK